MGKYVFVYYGGSAENGGSAEEWGAWFGKLGDKLVDGGNQFGGGAQAVTKGGVMDVKEMPATGYTIISADSMAAAVELAQDSPLLGDDKAAVCVYEALPM